MMVFTLATIVCLALVAVMLLVSDWQHTTELAGVVFRNNFASILVAFSMVLVVIAGASLMVGQIVRCGLDSMAEEVAGRARHAGSLQ